MPAYEGALTHFSVPTIHKDTEETVKFRLCACKDGINYYSNEFVVKYTNNRFTQQPSDVMLSPGTEYGVTYAMSFTPSAVTVEYKNGGEWAHYSNATATGVFLSGGDGEKTLVFRIKAIVEGEACYSREFTVRWANVTEVSSFEQLAAAVNADKAYIKLTGDIERVVAADELPPRLIFDGNVDYVLDLNGYSLEVINHINEYYTGKFAMITVSGESSLEIKNGYIGFDNWSTGSDRKSKGVVFVEDTATLVATKVSMRNLYTGVVVSAAEQASVTLDGGEYQVQNGFALFMSGQAALTLDGSVYIHTLVGDCASSAYVDGYGALYSESAGALVINNAFFKSGIQVHSSQIGAFSTATHEVMVNGKVLTEDIFDGTRSDAQNQNKEYYWYAFNGKALNKTEDSGFCNTVRVISYDKKYPIEITSGTAMVGGSPVTEASYGQTVTIVAGDPAPGKEFLRWGTTGALLGNDYTATTSFVMPAQPVALTAYYGNLAISAVELNVTAPVAGEKPNFQASAAGDVTTDMMEWFVVGGGALGENDVFFPGVQYGVRVLIYPGEDYKFADAVAPTVNGLTAQIQTGTAAYQIVEYHFAALPASVFTTYYKSSPQLGVGGKIELDVDAITGASDTFADALAAGKVSYQWY
ncbi:MAG: hypothetical protein IKW66_06200, partial [Clostridia bacterium]|nr:hypothetical protein [Clostridia bacterium]